LLIGLIALYAGFSILRGGGFGWIMGCLFAILGAGTGWPWYAR